jgi:hypothetical protein
MTRKLLIGLMALVAMISAVSPLMALAQATTHVESTSIVAKVGDAANNQIGLWIVTAIVAVVGAVATWALKKLGSYAHAAAQKAEIEHRSAYQVMLLKAVEALSDCADSAVQQIEDKVRPTLIGAANEGKLTPDQANVLKTQAIEIAWKQARECYGRAIEIAGITAGPADAAPTALTHLVEDAAQRLAGDSRALLPLSAAVPAPVPDSAAAA